MNSRKQIIRDILRYIPFKDIIVKYDYYLEGKLDSILSDVEDTEVGNYLEIRTLKDGRAVTNIQNEKYLIIWGLNTRKPNIKIELQFIFRFKILPNQNLITCSDNGVLGIWDTNSGQLIDSLRVDIDNPQTLNVISEDIIILTTEIQVYKVNIKTHQIDLLNIQGYFDELNTIIMGDNLIACINGKITIFNINTYQIKSIETPFADILYIFKISDELFAISGNSNNVIIYDINTLKEKAILKGHINTIILLLLLPLPDGRIVTGDHNGIIIVWKDYKVQYILTGHRSALMSMKLLPDGKLISGGEDDHIINVWNLDTGKLEITFPRIHRGMISQIEVLADGRPISAGGEEDGLIIVWK